MRLLYRNLITFCFIYITGLMYKTYIEHSEERYLSFEEIVTNKGYPLETHNITTADGYILTVFRIPHGKLERGRNIGNEKRSLSNNATSSRKARSYKRPVILLQHGIMDSSDAFISNIEGKSIAFNLANLGYDVWMGNNRGNKYSRKHKLLNPDYEPEFWDFSFHEMGIYDIPACIDYILSLTGANKLNYVGHSQGTMQMFAALSLKPEYFEKRIDSFVALAPVTELNDVKSLRLRLFMDLKGVSFISSIISEAFVVPNFSGNFISMLCEYLMPVCSHVFKIFSDIDIAELKFEEKQRFFDYISRLPSSTSAKAFEHFEMIYRNKKFIHFDYKEMNHQLYGQSEPLEYKLENIKNIRIALVIGHVDKLSNIDTVRSLQYKLEAKNDVSFHEYDDLGHHCFFFSEKFDWFKDIVHFLEKAKNPNKTSY